MKPRRRWKRADRRGTAHVRIPYEASCATAHQPHFEAPRNFALVHAHSDDDGGKTSRDLERGGLFHRTIKGSACSDMRYSVSLATVSTAKHDVHQLHRH